MPLRNCNLVELMRQVPQSSVRELSSAVGELNNMKCADDTNLIAAMLKHSSLNLQAAFGEYFNICIDQGKFDESWFKTIFRMLPKSGLRTGDQPLFFQYYMKSLPG